jgi:hypothetical protein
MNDHWLPNQVPGLNGATAVAVGAAHTCAVVRGQNNVGQLGGPSPQTCPYDGVNYGCAIVPTKVAR